MTGGEQLLLVDVPRELPGLWDGRRVVWSPFELEPAVFICDRSKRKNGLVIPTCDECGATGPKLRSTGLRDPERGAFEDGEVLRVHRNGEPVLAMELARPRRDLHASRCTVCGHDQVFDFATGESWDLDESDYGPEGSVAP